MTFARQTTTGCLICCLTFGSSLTWAWGQDGSAVVAEFGGKKITRAEFEQKEAATLLTPRYKLYLAEKQALDELLDQDLLQQQAQREHVTTAELLDRHVTQTIVNPTEEQIRVFYEGMQTDQPFEAVRDEIVDTIRRLRLTKARAAYLAKLREESSAKIELAPPVMDVQLGDAPVRGSKDAPVMLVEFADYQCPYCQKINPDLKKIQADFGDKVAMAFKDFPLPIHSRAPKAAEASHCAGEQGKYWEYHDILFEGKELDAEQLKRYAADLKLDQARFDACLDSGQEMQIVHKDLEEGKVLGLTQTPSFFVNGHFFSGAVPYATLHSIVAQQIASAERSHEGQRE